MITPEEIKEIQKQFNQVLQFSQSIHEANTDELFVKWVQAKALFIHNFDGLIKEYPNVSFALGEQEQQKQLSKFIFWCSQFDNEAFDHYLSNQTPQGFFNNIVEEDYMISEDKIIKKGMKLSKSFKFFISNPDTLEKIQTKMSMIIQENKISGTLCFSVHPLDYLSLSENSYHWRSCHSLDGEYRAGNLSYMVDNSTIICYLKNDGKNMPLGAFGSTLWNSKKWRCLLFASGDLNTWFAGRQYPFFAEGALEVIRTRLLDLMNDSSNEWSLWSNTQLNEFQFTYSDHTTDTHSIIPLVCLNHKMFELEDIIEDADGSKHFNDLLYSSCYKPFYMFNRYETHPKIFIGGAVTCIQCGEEEVSQFDTMLCRKCQDDCNELADHFYCERCDSWVMDDDGVWVEDDNYHICKYCADNECFRCEYCGELFFIENEHFDEETQKHVCNQCLEILKERREQNGSTRDNS